MSTKPRSTNQRAKKKKKTDFFAQGDAPPTVSSIPQRTRGTEVSNTNAALAIHQDVPPPHIQPTTKRYSIIWVRCKNIGLDEPICDEEGQQNRVNISRPSQSEDRTHTSPHPKRQKRSSESLEHPATEAPALSPSYSITLKYGGYWARYSSDCAPSTCTFTAIQPTSVSTASLENKDRRPGIPADTGKKMREQLASQLASQLLAIAYSKIKDDGGKTFYL